MRAGEFVNCTTRIHVEFWEGSETKRITNVHCAQASSKCLIYLMSVCRTREQTNEFLVILVSASVKRVSSIQASDHAQHLDLESAATVVVVSHF